MKSHEYRKNFPFGDLSLAKKVACDYYKTIGKIRCPALGGDFVTFTSKGMGHVLYKASRKEEDVIERLSLLCYAERIISNPYVKIEYRQETEKEYVKKGGEYVMLEVESQYWGFLREVEDGLTVKIIVRQVGSGGKYFYSIMKRNFE